MVGVARRFGLAGLIGCAGAWLGLGATRAAGRCASDRLRGEPIGHLLWPLLALCGWLLALWVLAFLWSRRARGRRGVERAAVLAGVTVLAGASYAASLRDGKHWSHGLVTFPPGMRVEDRTPTRPPTVTAINARGFRGDDWTESKPPGVTRVAVVGDSFVFGSGVADEETLPRRLAAALGALAPARRWEVLNLGLPGDNLASHVTLADVAAHDLAADVVILCVSIPNDLSRWDDQVAHRRRRDVGGYSLVSWLLGEPAAAALWTSTRLDREVTPEGLRFLAAEAARLGALRERRGAPPLLVFRYHDDEQSLPDLASLPHARAVLGPPDRPELWIEGDGHPTALGNRTFAALLASAVVDATGR